MQNSQLGSSFEISIPTDELEENNIEEERILKTKNGNAVITIS